MRWYVVSNLFLFAAGFGAGHTAASFECMVAVHSAQQSQGGTSADALFQSVVDAIKKYDMQALDRLGASAFDPLVSALKHEDADVRRMAAERLGLLRDPRALPFIVPLLNDPEYTVRSSAATALGRFRDQRAIEPLIAAMSDSDHFVRSFAAFSLRDLNWQPATDVLRATLLTAQGKFPEAAGLGAVSATPLLSVLKDRDAGIRRAGAEAMSKIPWQPETDLQRAYYFAALEKWQELAKLGPVAVEPLLVVMAAPTGDQRDYDRSRSATDTLKSLGPPAVPAIIAALKLPDNDVRRAAARVIGELPRDPRAVEALIAALGDSDKEQRAVAAGSLGRLGDLRAVEPLIQALKDRDVMTRSNAAIALGSLGDSRAMAPLTEALKDPDRGVQWSIGFALKRLSSKGSEGPLLAQLEDAEFRVRASAAEALAKMGDARAIEPAITALNASDPGVRIIAVNALGSLRDPRSVVPLTGRLQDEDRMVRGTAAYALERQGDARAVETLIAALKDEDSWVRGRVASALGALGDKRAVEPLRASLKSKDGHVNSNVAVALAHLVKDASAIEPLLSALRDPDSEETIMTVAGAFNEIGPSAVEPLIAVLKDVNIRRREGATRPQSGEPDPQRFISDHTLCAGVAWALMQMPDPRMLEPFIDLLQDPRIAQIAALGLVNFDDKRAAAPLTALFRNPNNPLLSRSRSPVPPWTVPSPAATEPAPDAVKSLIRALDDSSNPPLQRIAAWVLGWSGDKQAIDPLVAQLGKPSSNPWPFGQALVRLGDPRGIAPLLGAMKETAAQIDRSGNASIGVASFERSATGALGALASIGAPAMEPLIQVLQDSSPRMRSLAARGLGQLGDKRAVHALTATLKDPDERVRSAAADALRQLALKR